MLSRHFQLSPILFYRNSGPPGVQPDAPKGGYTPQPPSHRAPILPGCHPQKLPEIEAMIGQAEVQLAAHKLRLKREGRSPNPCDPFDQIGCLELWLAVLRRLRNDLLHQDETECQLGRFGPHPKSKAPDARKRP